MIKLPKNIPHDLYSALAPVLELSSWPNALEKIAEAVLNLFHATDVLASFEMGSPGSTQGKHQLFFIGPSAAQTNGGAQSICQTWCSSSIHRILRRDLKNRLAGLSYSAFSWPYAQVMLPQTGDEEKVIFPRDYSLFLPFSSELIVRSETETEFFGYLALFFDSFPNLGEGAIQLIVSLPALLSDFARAYMPVKYRQQASDISGYAHDMKRYLLINREYVHLLKTGDEDAKGMALSGMQRSLLRALQQTNSILLLDKEEQGKLKVSTIPVQVNELVFDAANDMQILFESAGTELSVNLAQDIPPAALDPSLFPSVIYNLLDNALKYSVPNKKVWVETNYQGGDCVQLEVSDNGAPLNLEEHERIFLRGYRGTNSGSCGGNGLGLYLVRRVVEAHGGKVRFEQKANRTKSFTVEIPLALIEQ